MTATLLKSLALCVAKGALCGWLARVPLVIALVANDIIQ
jgi:hypothetical protein